MSFVDFGVFFRLVIRGLGYRSVAILITPFFHNGPELSLGPILIGSVGGTSVCGVPLAVCLPRIPHKGVDLQMLLLHCSKHLFSLSFDELKF